MTHAKRNIAIVPARGGSKGVHRKNIRDLGGKPLIAWSIQQALDSGVVDRVIVTTNDEEIASIAREWGAETPFMRPASMAEDQSCISEAISHAIRKINDIYKFQYKTAIILYPSHPFRTQGMIVAAAESLSEGRCTNFSTVKTINEDLVRFSSFNDDGTLITTRQGMPLKKNHYFRNYGLVTATRLRTDGGKTYLYPVSDPVQLMDIDSEDDLRLANMVVERRLYDYYA